MSFLTLHVYLVYKGYQLLTKVLFEDLARKKIDISQAEIESQEQIKRNLFLDILTLKFKS